MEASDRRVEKKDGGMKKNEGKGTEKRGKH